MPLTRAARMGLGLPDLELRPYRRGELASLGGRLSQNLEAPRQHVLIQSYARDTGAILTTLSVPLYAKGQLYGAVSLGWHPDKLHQ
ncbi:MAG TPA: hypothetical protein VHV75_07440 [Solirubrobacteraceae bacterium]|nr:hypothetical protein [Solirubrobacteraceae bacterium]